MIEENIDNTINTIHLKHNNKRKYYKEAKTKTPDIDL